VRSSAFPAAAAEFLGANGTVTIEHIGENQVPLGQTVTVVGTSTVSPDLVIRIFGPNLPAEGVSPANFKGSPGEGVPVAVGNNSRWTYTWYTSWVRASIPFTAVYTIRASDAANPGIFAEVPIKIVKPDMATLEPPGHHTQGLCHD
jgi:hypothetical protein